MCAENNADVAVLTPVSTTYRTHKKKKMKTRLESQKQHVTSNLKQTN